MKYASQNWSFFGPTTYILGPEESLCPIFFRAFPVISTDQYNSSLTVTSQSKICVGFFFDIRVRFPFLGPGCFYSKKIPFIIGVYRRLRPLRLWANHKEGLEDRLRYLVYNCTGVSSVISKSSRKLRDILEITDETRVVMRHHWSG